jgi:plasmid maintenance system killer protein
MQENQSMIAAFRQQQALEYEAAQRGLQGLAMVASHESITARMEMGAERLLQMIEEGRHEEALAIMDLPMWGVAEPEEPGISNDTTKLLQPASQQEKGGEGKIQL